MVNSDSPIRLIDGKLIDELYCEAMILADEVRAYLEGSAGFERELLDPVDRVNFSCESLKITTRLMQVIAWLLSRRAHMRGEITLVEARSEKYRLGDAASSDLQLTRSFPVEMRILIAASESLYGRALRLEEQMIDDPHHLSERGHGPARELMRRLETAF